MNPADELPPFSPDALTAYLPALEHAMPEDVDAIRGLMVRCVVFGMSLPIGSREIAAVAFASMMGEADAPNTVLAPNHSRAVVSRWVNRCRRSYGLGAEYPKKARAGRKKGAPKK